MGFFGFRVVGIAPILLPKPALLDGRAGLEQLISASTAVPEMANLESHPSNRLDNPRVVAPHNAVRE